MSELAFHDLGNNVNKDAGLLQRLYTSPGVDESVRQEFHATVTAYQSLSLACLRERVRERYGGSPPNAYGVIGSLGEEPIGQALWGEKAFQTAGMSAEITGINISAWLLQEHRNRGFGTLLLTRAVESVIKDSHLAGKPVWTSIHQDNTASKTVCKRIGFFELGIQAANAQRNLYLLEQGSAIH